MKGWRASDIQRKQKGGTIAAQQGTGKAGKTAKEPEQGFIPFAGETFRKPRKKQSQAEYRLHVSSTTWLQWAYPVEWEDCWHYPGRPGSAKHGHFLKQMDAKKGIWDYCLDLPRHGFERCHIEFKIDTGLSDEQKAFRLRNRHRIVFAVVKSLDAFMAVVAWYLGPSPKMANHWK